ncbi:MAG TPA: hypothetical protein VMB19_14955 [Silvibacterium sp.]|nr:hypothetical protein [Silvibacterium sp.]
MAFEQAAIKVEKTAEYAALEAAIGQAYSPGKVEQFLKRLDRKGVRVRDIDAVLARKVLDGFSEPAVNALRLYQALTVSDQALLREFYLSKLEAVEVTLRHRFKKLYQYY